VAKDFHSVLEDSWRERLRLASLRYETAKQRVKELSASDPAAEKARDMLPSPDGEFAYTLALRAFRFAMQDEVMALKEYNRILKVYADLMVHGKIPPEE
jgi:hypothetical protein